MRVQDADAGGAAGVETMKQYEFRIMRFGKPLSETVVVEAGSVSEAMEKAKKYLGKGEYLGRLEPQ